MSLRQLYSLLCMPAARSSAAAAEAQKKRGNDYLAAGDPDKAADCYREAIRLQPKYAEAYVNLGFVLKEAGRYGEAESILAQAVALDPQLWQAHFNLGAVCEALGDGARAIVCYEQAVQRAEAAQVFAPQVFWKLAALYAAQASYEDVLRLMKTVVACDPDEFEAHCNIAAMLNKLGRADEGITYLQGLLAEKPHYLVAQFLGLAYQQEQQWLKAREYLELACRLNPNYFEPGFDIALLLLLQGDYENGWLQFEKYLPLVRDKSIAADVAQTEAQYYREKFSLQKYWQGDDLRGKRLLLWTEQGLGDTLMMLRYLPLLQARGAKQVLFLCEPALARLVASMPGNFNALPKPDNMDSIDFDCHCSLLSLPFLFHTRLDTIPRDIPYLAVPDENKARWRDRLAALSGLKVGLVWAGNRKLVKDKLRSIPLRQFAPLFDIAGITWISLQKGDGAAELGGAAWPLADWMDECHDLLDTAGLVEQLDLVISVDTAMVHLSGALGRPTWLLNRHESEWRWLLDREDSPWYPTVRIFRQQAVGEWHSTISKLAGALEELVTRLSA